jgi:virginiamycin B lyase
MPLGIAVDSHTERVWYISTKTGVIGSYDLRTKKFYQEYVIPDWKVREDPLGYSQVWDLKIHAKSKGAPDELWFTDEAENAIWKYTVSNHTFEMYKIPGNSSSFGTIYPISIYFDSNNASRVFIAGTFSTSLWIGDIPKMRNGTSDGIHQVPIPIDDKFKGIDPIHITTGSIAFDSKRNAVWISILAYGTKGEIFKYDLNTKSFEAFDLPNELNSPVGLVLDNSDNLWVTNAGTSLFYKLNAENGNIVVFATSKASPRVYGNMMDQTLGVEREANSTTAISSTSPTNKNSSEGIYTLPYWIKKASGGSLWFNEQAGNKIARFDPDNMKLIEYWIPTQNRVWGNCPSNNIINNSQGQERPCGIANVLQFSVMNNNKQTWFTEWSENKIGKIDIRKKIPFSVETVPQKEELSIKGGESVDIGVKVKSTEGSSSSSENIHMIASGTFTPTGDLGNSTGYFNKESFQLPREGRTTQVSFIFTPSIDLTPGEYMLMIGAEDDSVSYLKALMIRIT